MKRKKKIVAQLQAEHLYLTKKQALYSLLFNAFFNVYDMNTQKCICNFLTFQFDICYTGKINGFSKSTTSCPANEQTASFPAKLGWKQVMPFQMWSRVTCLRLNNVGLAVFIMHFSPFPSNEWHGKGTACLLFY